MIRSLVIIMILSVVACGDGIDNDSSFEDAVEIVTRAPDTEQEMSQPSDAPQNGGVFRFFTGNAIIPDPAVGESWRLYGEIYNGLTRIVDDWNAPVQMDLAESYSVDASGRVYTFLLRPNLKFSDGSPLSADDFKWSWERALNLDTESATPFQSLAISSVSKRY